MLIPCSGQKMIPARNAIVAHAHSYLVNDKLLLPIQKTYRKFTRWPHALPNTWRSCLCPVIWVEQSVTTTDSSSLAPPTGQQSPHCSRHGQPVLPIFTNFIISNLTSFAVRLLQYDDGNSKFRQKFSPYQTTHCYSQRMVIDKPNNFHSQWNVLRSLLNCLYIVHPVVNHIIINKQFSVDHSHKMYK
jgi:hypothetical protein